MSTIMFCVRKSMKDEQESAFIDLKIQLYN